MATYPISELKGKTIYLKPGKTAIVYSKLIPSNGTGVIAYKANDNLNNGRVGIVKSFVEFRQNVPDVILGLWLVLEGGLFVKWYEGKFKKPEGIQTTAQIEAEQAKEEKEQEKEESKANEDFATKALRTLTTVTVIGLAGWVLISLGKEAINKKQKSNYVSNI